MYHYFDAIQNSTGDAQPGYFVRLLDSDTQAVVSIYADENGTPIITASGVANMAKTDDLGNVDFYVEPETYILEVYAPDTITLKRRVTNVAMTSTQGEKGDTGDTGPIGPTGPSNNTRATLATLKAAATTDLTSLYDNSLWNWTLGDFTGQADDINVVKANSTALAVGAWVRQKSSALTFQQTGTGAVARTAQAKLNERVTPEDFGAVADGVTNCYDAFRAAATYCTSTGKKLWLPGADYLYRPPVGGARLDINFDMEGSGRRKTRILCNPANYTGEFFRVIDSFKVSGFWLQCTTDGVSTPKLGTGLRLCPANVNEFTGFITVDRVSVTGFNINIQVDNIFITDLSNVRTEFGNEGFYCAPADVGGDNGYVTTLRLANFYASANTRNIYINPALKSPNVIFDNVIAQEATGAAEQVYINNVRPLTIISAYFEGAPTIPAMRLSNSETSIGAVYLNGTGGITLATAANVIKMTNAVASSATDIFVANGASLQSVELEDVSLPASGNVLNANTLWIKRSTINGTSYGELHRGGGIELQKIGQSSTPVKGILSQVLTWPLTTIAANSNDYLSGTSTGVVDSAVAIAMEVIFTAATVPLKWKVIPVLDSDHYRLYAENYTGSGINIPNGTQVRVTFIQH